MVKLLHTADLHLDSPFSGLTPEEALRRRRLLFITAVCGAPSQASCILQIMTDPLPRVQSHASPVKTSPATGFFHATASFYFAGMRFRHWIVHYWYALP